MDSETTTALFIAGLGLALFASFGDLARRRTPLAWHAHIPWHALIFAGAVLAMFAAVHSLNLMTLAH